MAFDAPDRVEPGEYTILFENVGVQYHELAFKDSSGKVLSRRSIAGGSMTSMKVRLEAGTYELGCFEPGPLRRRYAQDDHGGPLQADRVRGRPPAIRDGEPGAVVVAHAHDRMFSSTATSSASTR